MPVAGRSKSSGSVVHDKIERMPAGGERGSTDSSPVPVAVGITVAANLSARDEKSFFIVKTYCICCSIGARRNVDVAEIYEGSIVAQPPVEGGQISGTT